MAFTTTQDSDPSSARDRLRVAAVQMKFAPTIAENLAKTEQLLGEAARRADVVLLPECATTGYAYWQRMVGAVRRQAAKSSLAYDLPAIVDAHESNRPTEQSHTW